MTDYRRLYIKTTPTYQNKNHTIRRKNTNMIYKHFGTEKKKKKVDV